MIKFAWQFGERFRWIRKTTKLTQEHFGQILGVSRQTINAYENDRQRPTLDMMEKVCRDLDVSPSWLLVGIGEPKGEGSYLAVSEGGPVQMTSEASLSPEQLSLVRFVTENRARANNLARILFDEGLKNLADQTDEGAGG